MTDQQRTTAADPDGMLDRITALAQLQPGWLDGDGRTVRPRCIAQARQAVHAITKHDLPAPGIYPTVTGGIQFEWQPSGSAPATVIELELEPRGGIVTTATWTSTDTVDGDHEHRHSNIAAAINCVANLFGR